MDVRSEVVAQHATSNASIGRIGAMSNMAVSKRNFDIRIQWNHAWEDGECLRKSCGGKDKKICHRKLTCYNSVTSADSLANL